MYIFGAGNIGRIMCHYLQGRGIVPKAYLDNNASLWGTEIGQISVIPPDGIRLGDGELFLICSENYADEIGEDLRKKGIAEAQMAVVDDMDACIRFIVGQMKGWQNG